jgi:hypothetical protein
MFEPPRCSNLDLSCDMFPLSVGRRPVALRLRISAAELPVGCRKKEVGKER